MEHCLHRKLASFIWSIAGDCHFTNGQIGSKQ